MMMYFLLWINHHRYQLCINILLSNNIIFTDVKLAMLHKDKDTFLFCYFFKLIFEYRTFNLNRVFLHCNISR